jgi:hypothetical protein
MSLELKHEDWSAFLHWVTETLAGALTEIEVVSLAIGHQVQTEWVTLLGVAYDDKDDLVELVLPGLDHMIHHPRQIFVDEDAFGLIAIDIVDRDGVHEIIRFKHPLLLASPDSPPAH